MKNEKKGFLLKTAKQMNRGAAASALGFLLYLLVSVLNLGILKDIVVVAGAALSIWVFASVAERRNQDKEAVSYNLLWGTGALALMMALFAFATIRMRLGL